MTTLGTTDKLRWLARVRDGSPVVWAVVAIVAQLCGAWFLAYVVGGPGHLTPAWFYLPILYAGIRFGVTGAIATGIVAGVLAGPLLPFDVGTGVLQSPMLWIPRLAMFAGLGAGLTLALDRAMAPLQLERRDLRFRHELRRGLERNELVLHYQPLLDLSSGRIGGFEALVRWQHPDRGLLGPGEFVAAAERDGMILPLGAWIAEQACRQASWWQKTLRTDGDPVFVAINLSAEQLSTPGLADRLLLAMRQTAVDPTWVHLEVTETALLDDLGLSGEQLSELRDRGFHVAVDDFGTGYASLTYLRDLPTDSVKIDQVFVAGLGRSAADEAIVAAVVSLAHSLGKRTVAEGVETAEQLQALRRLGCDYAQGWYVGRPLPAEALAGIFARWGACPPLPVGTEPAPADDELEIVIDPDADDFDPGLEIDITVDAGDWVPSSAT